MTAGAKRYVAMSVWRLSLMERFVFRDYSYKVRRVPFAWLRRRWMAQYLHISGDFATSQYVTEEAINVTSPS